MLLSIQDILMSLSLAQVIAPVATYFLILGLLNSRPRPQMLTGLEDALVLWGAMSMFFWPTLTAWLGMKLFVSILAASGVLLGMLFLTCRAKSWVVYNLPAEDARQIVRQVLADLQWSSRESKRDFRLPGGQCISFDGFALMRNVTIRLHGASADERQLFSRELAQRLSRTPAEVAVAASAMVMVAAGMLAVMATVMAPHAPEIARQVAEFLP